MLRVPCIAFLFALAGVALAQSAGDPAPLSLTLPEAIEQALRGNPSLVDARLDRILERNDAEEAERRFRPQWRLRTSVGYGYGQAEATRTATAVAGPGVEMELPTGGRLAVGPEWARTLTGDREPVDSSALVVSIVQPLGRGAGPAIARAPIERARLAERANVLELRGVLTDVVTEVVTAYRALIRAERQAAIERRSLEEVIRSREVVRVLIEAGRVARTDLTQSEADVADREFEVARSRIALEDAQAALAVLLGLDAGQRVKPADALPDAPPLPDLEGSLERALGDHTGYQAARLALRRSELDRTLAEDTRRWDVALSARANFAGTGRSAGSSFGDLAGGLDSRGDYLVTLDLNLPLGSAAGAEDERTRLAARVGHVKANRAFAAARRELEIEVRQAAERVRSGHRQVRLAAEALTLAREQVRIEEGKLRLGLTSAYHMGRVRSALVTAETREVSAKIDYLNALSELDRVEGAVLRRWNIVFEDAAAALPDLPGR